MAASLPGPARHPSRWLIALLAGAMLAVSVAPAATLAARPQHVVDTVYTVNAGRTTTSDGTLGFNVQFSDVTGPRAYFAYWGPDQIPGGEEARVWGFERSAGVDGNRLFGDMWSFTDEHEFAGLATFELDFTPSGDVEISDRTWRIGNQRTVLHVTEQRMSVSGTVTMPDGTAFEIVGATGHLETFETHRNQPASRVDDGSQTFIDALWMVDGIEIGFRIIQSEISSEAVAFVYDELGEIVGLGRPKIADGRLVHTFDLARTDGSPGGTPVGTATVDLSIDSLGSHTYVESHEGYRARVTEEELAVVGTFEVDLGEVSYSLSFADASTYALGTTWHSVQRPIKRDGGGGEG